MKTKSASECGKNDSLDGTSTLQQHSSVSCLCLCLCPRLVSFIETHGFIGMSTLAYAEQHTVYIEFARSCVVQKYFTLFAELRGEWSDF